MALPQVPDSLLLVVAFTGMALLGWGALWRDKRNHFPRMAGWILFGLYWPFKAPHYFEVGDPFNAWFSLAAPLLTGYIAYHEYLSWKWDEDPVGLRWLTGATFVAATAYFVLFEITPIQETIIYYTGVESAWLTDTLFGTNSIAVQDPRINAEGYRPTHLCLDQGYGVNQYASFCDASVVGQAAAGFEHYAVTIIFACTALQSIMIFVGAIAFTKAKASRKWKAYAITIPTIYALNLFRNAGIVYGYRVKGYTMFGLDSFEFMHSYVAKTGAIVALVVIALAIFRTLPELHENILDVLELPKRKRAEPPGPPATPAPDSS
ncbi:MAG: archaeosortase A [Candidatus Thermoplasmatota archaeon]|nr:archaeosortase A [Candidatus Thermoplasmatota archaeon]